MSSQAIAWLRNSLKNVDSEQEQSAYGLNSVEGVIVLKVWKGSPAVRNNGIKKGDVILEVADQKTSNLKAFFRANAANNNEELKLLVMRDQSEIELNISIK